jgi:hypothetical protein
MNSLGKAMEHQRLPRRMYWDARGYHAFPLTDEDRLDDAKTFPAWQAFDRLLGSAKRGRFHELRMLIDLHRESEDWVIRGAVVKLLGDAGEGRLLRDLLYNIYPTRDNFDQYDYGEALVNWGNLSAIPALVELYAANFESQDAKFIPPRLSRLLEAEPGPIRNVPRNGSRAAIADYHGMVMDKYEELCRTFGTSDTYVFRGGGLHVTSVAERILRDFQKQQFSEEMRHKFEAMTGIDCSGFYVDRHLQPLAAAGIVEEFLDSDASDRYELGVRYFFGYRVPE